MLDYPLEDVIDLMRHDLDYNRRTRQREAQAPQAIHGNTQEVIYRKADDSWF
jgi:hypothetical protein